MAERVLDEVAEGLLEPERICSELQAPRCDKLHPPLGAGKSRGVALGQMPEEVEGADLLAPHG
jgi:hypothetical protein